MTTSKAASDAYPYDGSDPAAVVSHREAFDRGQAYALGDAATAPGLRLSGHSGVSVRGLQFRAALISGALRRNAEADRA